MVAVAPLFVVGLALTPIAKLRWYLYVLCNLASTNFVRWNRPPANPEKFRPAILDQQRASRRHVHYRRPGT
jgi:hypothetical protein